MPIEKITAAQFRDQLRRGITDRTSSHEVGFGPIRDIVIDPVAAVLETQNDRARALSLLLSLINPDNLAETDVDGIVFNEGMRRNEGSRATTTVTFRTTQIDPTGPDLLVQRGFPVATTPDANTGETVTFVTTEARTLPVAQRASFFNIVTQQYELQVPARATTEGSVGRVGASRIRRPLRPLVGFDDVTNISATEGGLDRETNAELIARYLLSILGRDLSTPSGVEFYTRNNFPEVEDVAVVFGSDALLERAAEDAGAVDAYVIGDALIARTENLEFLGINQLITLNFPPLRVVTAVTSGATSYIEGVDFEVVQDTSGNQGSVRASEGVRFLATATSPLPVVGTAVTIAYTQNNLITSLQTTSEQRDVLVLGRNLLYKEGDQIDIILEGQLRVATNFSTIVVPNAVATSIQDFINGLGLGANVENSDIQGEVRRISGVDNFIITRLVRDAALTGSADITIDSNEYPRISVTDLVITLI